MNHVYVAPKSAQNVQAFCFSAVHEPDTHLLEWAPTVPTDAKLTGDRSFAHGDKKPIIALTGEIAAAIGGESSSGVRHSGEVRLVHIRKHNHPDKSDADRNHHAAPYPAGAIHRSDPPRIRRRRKEPTRPVYGVAACAIQAADRRGACTIHP